MDFDDFERAKRDIGFGDEAATVLRAFLAVAQSQLAAIVDELCRWLEHESAARWSGGADQVDRLGSALLGWIDSTLQGPYDAAYLEKHARIGRVHAERSLPQHLMILAMSRIRSRLTALAEHLMPAPTETMLAVDKVLDLELAILLDAYRRGMETRLRTQERLATIGQLAASIGHELRSPLGVIESSTFLIRQRLTPTNHTEAVIRHLDKIGAQVRVCNTTMTELLELARRRPPSRRDIVVRDLIEGAIESAADVPPHQVERDIPAEMTMRADPDQMRQVFVNLVSNAHQAHRGQGHVWITAERVDGGTLVRVRDDGPGVPATIRDRVFEALFTTKPHGTGLGLALCRLIIEAHRGRIFLEPSDVGACFGVYVPDGDTASAQGVDGQTGDLLGPGT